MLAAIGASMQRALGSADPAASTNVAARIGGEEFAVVFAEPLGRASEAGRAEALALAEELRKAIATTFVDDAGVTVSVGVASQPQDGVSSQELISAADEALLRAIAEGGNRVAVTEREDDEGARPLGSPATGGV
jgi:diguanylate cyclase (GGDEF)-like protein